jgi:hypothetical protein
VQPKPPAAVLQDLIVLEVSFQKHLLATGRFDRHAPSGAVQLALYAWQTPWFRRHCSIIQTATGTCTDYNEVVLCIEITSPGLLAPGFREERRNRGEVACLTVTRVTVIHHSHLCLRCELVQSASNAYQTSQHTLFLFVKVYGCPSALAVQAFAAAS